MTDLAAACRATARRIVAKWAEDHCSYVHDAETDDGVFSFPSGEVVPLCAAIEANLLAALKVVEAAKLYQAECHALFAEVAMDEAIAAFDASVAP